MKEQVAVIILVDSDGIHTKEITTAEDADIAVHKMKYIHYELKEV